MLLTKSMQMPVLMTGYEQADTGVVPAARRPLYCIGQFSIAVRMLSESIS